MFKAKKCICEDLLRLHDGQFITKVRIHLNAPEHLDLNLVI